MLLAIMLFAGALRADDADDRVQDIAQMKRVWEALMSYKKEHGKLPDELSQLVPDFLRNPKDLLSPRDDGEKENGPLTRKEEKYPSSYGYEWGPQPFRGLTFTDIKTCQVEEYGPVVPLLRCFLHTPVLNISHAGDFYETETNWEIDPAVEKIIKERGLGPGASKGQFLDLTTTDPAGAPLAGVKVIARNRFIEGIWLPERTLITDEDGRARIPFGPVQTMLGSLEFQKPGHFAFPQNGSPDGFKPSIKVMLNKTRQLSGKVVDSMGKPLANAAILIKQANAEDAPDNPGAWFPTAIPRVADTNQIDFVHTDANGKWTTNLVPDDPALRIKAAISHESSAVKVLLLNRAELERSGFVSGSAKITLPEPAQVRGTLRNPDGSPAVDTAMFLYTPLDPTVAGRKVAPIETKSRRDGRFEFRSRVPGEIQVVAVPKTSAPLLRKATSSSSTPSMDLQLAAGRAIGGKVVDSRGQPVAGVQILFVGWVGVGALPLNPVIATSDAAGKWQWAHAPAEPAWGSAICPSGELIYWSDTGNAPITITIPPSEMR